MLGIRARAHTLQRIFISVRINNLALVRVECCHVINNLD